MRKMCVCGHPKTEHTIMAGPNSIGQWQHGLCGHGAEHIGPYAIAKCPCGSNGIGIRTGFKLSWRRTIAASLGIGAGE